MAGRKFFSGLLGTAAVAATILLGAAAAPAADTIKIGGIFDITGATSDVGADYARAANDAVAYINANGGINGKKLEINANDYAYKIPDAVNLYKTYKDDGIFLIQGWGTGDTNALKEMVNADQIVYMSASYDSGISDPAKTPYNFFVGTSYGDSIRSAMQFVKDTWADKSRAPKVVFIYPDHPYGKNPIPAGKEMAKALGLEIGPDQDVSLKATEAVSQLTEMKKFNPDYAWIGGTVASAAVIVKDAAKLGLTTKFLINVWGFNENLAKLAGDAAKERVYGMVPFTMYGDDVPGMKPILEIHQKNHPNDIHIQPYIQGWTSMMVMWEAMKRAKTMDAAGVKAALETLKDFNTGGLSAPITFTPTDHRPNTSLRIMTVNKDGKIVLVKQVGVERKAEWLGK
jgi:branched-chain amino acid transport system substrate-binding protein